MPAAGDGTSTRVGLTERIPTTPVGPHSSGQCSFNSSQANTFGALWDIGSKSHDVRSPFHGYPVPAHNDQWRPMASILQSPEPPRTPPTPSFVGRDKHNGESPFRFNITYHDNHQDQEPPPPDRLRVLSTSPRSSPADFLHPHRSTTLRPPSTASAPVMASDDGLANGGGAPSSTAPKNPFNFQTQFISTAPIKPNLGQRRGHRYKHSSISAQHQIFQEPPPRPPPVLPASLPIPTLKEAWGSMQRDQRARLWWCCCHAAVAMYVFFSGEGSLAMTALSHLVFFDVGSAAVSLAVDVLGNFEVWRRSTIRHPFGLQRAEVLAGFAMSVFLVFGGFDLISHNLKHFLESVGEHGAHQPHAEPAAAASSSTTHNHHHDHGHSHSHGHTHGARYVSPGTVDLASLAAVVSTLVSAYGLRNHGRIRQIMTRVPLRFLPGSGLLANPFHFLTLCFSFLLLLLPLVNVPHFVWLDRLVCGTIALSMFVLGARLAVAQGLMLLMSYSPRPSPSSGGAAAPAQKGGLTSSNDPAGKTLKKLPPRTYTFHTVSSVLREIEAEPRIAKVEDAQFWQVHYGLAMANLKVRLASPRRGDGGAGGDGYSTSSGMNPGGVSTINGAGSDIDDGALGAKIVDWQLSYSPDSPRPRAREDRQSNP
ncbi:hypothetical protein VTJ49DRAFT_4464 [Mycothermus thermophilus]|uniref:Zinc transporter n=1 Tax=Humicola insolens TaxID=85995 RepID=A0ABR3VLA5_HUMIN